MSFLVTGRPRAGPVFSPASCEPVQQFHNEQLANIGVPTPDLYNGPCRLFYRNPVFRHVLDAKREAETTQSLLPGYAFDVFLVSGMTPIEQGARWISPSTGPTA
jgi:hypothetical protein